MPRYRDFQEAFCYICLKKYLYVPGYRARTCGAITCRVEDRKRENEKRRQRRMRC
jgi:hypothetical protein